MFYSMEETSLFIDLISAKFNYQSLSVTLLLTQKELNKSTTSTVSHMYVCGFMINNYNN